MHTGSFRSTVSSIAMVVSFRVSAYISAFSIVPSPAVRETFSLNALTGIVLELPASAE